MGSMLMFGGSGGGGGWIVIDVDGAGGMGVEGGGRVSVVVMASFVPESMAGDVASRALRDSLL